MCLQVINKFVQNDPDARFDEEDEELMTNYCQQVSQNLLKIIFLILPVEMIWCETVISILFPPCLAAGGCASVPKWMFLRIAHTNLEL